MHVSLPGMALPPRVMHVPRVLTARHAHRWISHHARAAQGKHAATQPPPSEPRNASHTLRDAAWCTLTQPSGRHGASHEHESSGCLRGGCFAGSAGTGEVVWCALPGSPRRVEQHQVGEFLRPVAPRTAICARLCEEEPLRAPKYDRTLQAGLCVMYPHVCLCTSMGTLRRTTGPCFVQATTTPARHYCGLPA